MEHAPEDAPLNVEGRSDSQQALLQPTGQQGVSNSRAVKIAGITTLVCLLVSAQVFTAYIVFDQRQQIQGLQVNQQKVERQMGQRTRVMPQKMVMPIGSLPLLDFDGKTSAKSAPKPKAPMMDVAPPNVEQQLQEIIKGQDLPEMNKAFLDNLQTLKQKVSETEWKSFETWMQNWLVFQQAQKTPTSTPQPDAEKQ